MTGCSTHSAKPTRICSAGRAALRSSPECRRQLSRCLGAQLRQIWALETLRVESGDRILLATDGITTLGEATIKERLSAAANAQSAVDGLLRAIEDAMAMHQDNATVVALLVP